MKRCVVTFAFALLLLLTSLPASAIPSTCEDWPGRTCIYTSTGYTGSVTRLSGNNSSWSAWSAFNNEDSAWNNGTTGLGFRTFKEETWVTPSWCLPRGFGYSNISTANDNDGESNLWTSYC